MSTVLRIFLAAVIAYLMGSISPSIIQGRMHGVDIKKEGSGNAGTTNTLRVLGRKAALITLTVDIAKGVIAVLIGNALGGEEAGYLCALAVFCGHIWPCFFGFKGGKGVAVSAAAMLMLNPTVFAVIFVCFVIIVGGTKYVSLGSVMCALLYPVILNTVNNEILYPYLIALGVTRFGPDVLFAVLMAIFVVVMHRENIKRLIAGNESKVSFGKKSAQEDKKNDKR